MENRAKLRFDPVTVHPQAVGMVTAEVARLLGVLEGEQQRSRLQHLVGIKHDEHFRRAYLLPALGMGLIEMTVPGKPTSRLQRYRLTEKGAACLDAIHRKHK